MRRTADHHNVDEVPVVRTRRSRRWHARACNLLRWADEQEDERSSPPVTCSAWKPVAQCRRRCVGAEESVVPSEDRLRFVGLAEHE